VNDTRIRHEIARCDMYLEDPLYWLDDGETALHILIAQEDAHRVSWKHEQLALWIETYGTAE
jgi:hypothetical protein